MSGEFNFARYSGKHLILDLFGVSTHKLCNLDDVKACLEKSALQAGATILETNFHHFGEGYGLTGVIILAESHISIHTWPEEQFAAIDIFMCGSCNPENTLSVINDYFSPSKINYNILYRGLVDT